MRVAFAVLLLSLLVGCGPATSGAPSGQPVGLRTADRPLACMDMGEAEGLLVADPAYGTAITQDFVNGSPGDGTTLPVMWPQGFTGLRLAGGEVVVLSRDGDVVATTGGRYGLARANTAVPNSNVFDGFFVACVGPTAVSP